jgi:hypothetical protein
MYFRFGCALFLVVAISLAGTALEKRNLELRRAMTAQKYQQELLRDAFTRKRLQVQQLAAPTQTIKILADKSIGLHQPDAVVGSLNKKNGNKRAAR